MVYASGTGNRRVATDPLIHAATHPLIPVPTTVLGVDFSGAKLAGRNIWLARAVPASDRAEPGLTLASLDRLEDLCGSAERDLALAWLVDHIRAAAKANEPLLVAADFPFGLPIEVVPDCWRWPMQLEALAKWLDGASALGLECVRRAKLLGAKLHIRRQTDSESKTPFDCYHYRIIYQTFHGMRDVLKPLAADRNVAVLPFQYTKVGKASAIVVEACPSSTLKRLALPYHNYKQPTGGRLTAKRRRTRAAIVEGIRRHIALTDRQVRTIMRNPGGDALDAVIAAAGGWHAWRQSDHAAIRRHKRYPVEGYVYF